MEALFDDSKFLIQYPVWMLIHATELSSGHLKLNGSHGEAGFPLFTDKDLAQRFKTSMPPLAHYAIGMAKDRTTLQKLLDMLKKQGFTHLSIDPTNTKSQFIPLGEFSLAVDGSDATS